MWLCNASGPLDIPLIMRMLVKSYHRIICIPALSKKRLINYCNFKAFHFFSIPLRKLPQLLGLSLWHFLGFKKGYLQEVPRVEKFSIAIQFLATYVIVMCVSNHSGSIKIESSVLICLSLSTQR